MQNPNREQVLWYLNTEATEADLEAFIAAMKTRRRTLAQIAAASIEVGSTVTTDSRLAPRYLANRTGTVKHIERQGGRMRARVVLTEADSDEIKVKHPGTNFCTVDPDTKRLMLNIATEGLRPAEAGGDN